MTSSSTRHRLALLALGAVVIATGPGHLGNGGPGALDRTAAAFTSEASVAGVVGTVRACVGDPRAYTSGLVDAAAPLLRWSFPGEATPDAGPAGTSTAGLLVCDPADLAAGGDAGASAVRSLDLTGAAGGGLSSAPLTTTGAATLLLWVRAEPGAADGELASLAHPTAGDPVTPAEPGDPVDALSTDVPAADAPPTDAPPTDPEAADDVPPAGTDDSPLAPAPAETRPADEAGADAVAPASAPTDTTPDATSDTPGDVVPDGLVLTLVGDGVQLVQVHTGTTTVLATAPLTRGVTHLVAASSGPATDGTPAVTLAVDGDPAGPAVPLARPLADVSLTVGARPTATAAVARVDEVTVLPVELTAEARRALVAADRWWSRGPAPVSPAG